MLAPFHSLVLLLLPLWRTEFRVDSMDTFQEKTLCEQKDTYF